MVAIDVVEVARLAECGDPEVACRHPLEQGRIVVSGPLTSGDPGALLILDAADPDEVAALLDSDPFHVLGLIAGREIRRWNRAFGAARLLTNPRVGATGSRRREGGGDQIGLPVGPELTRVVDRPDAGDEPLGIVLDLGDAGETVAERPSEDDRELVAPRRSIVPIGFHHVGSGPSSSSRVHRLAWSAFGLPTPLVVMVAGTAWTKGIDVAGEARDIERIYSTAEVVAKLRRLADALESGTSFRIQIAGERFRVPLGAQFSVEHERGDGAEEVEFQLKWKLDDAAEGAADGTLV